MHNTIFIEGLPGSGKTTYAKRISNYLTEQGHRVVHFVEGDLHPIDLAWCAYVTEEEYNEIQSKYKSFADAITAQTKREKDHYIIAYTRVRHELAKQSFYDDMAKYEIYHGHTKEDFLQAHLNRWKYFNETFDPNTVYVFECVFLQNHITELILNYNQAYNEMIPYFTILMDTIKDTNPMILYIEQANIPKTFEKTIEERRSDQPDVYRDWIDNVIQYLASTTYASKLGFTGKEGMIRYGTYRQSLEIKLLDDLEIPSHVFLLDDDYDTVFDDMIQTLNV